MPTKTLTYALSAAKAPTARGEFEAFVAETWPADAPKDFADHDGDIFEVGAFDEQHGASVPLIYQHTYSDPFADLGHAILRPLDSRTNLPARGKLRLGEPMADAIHERMLLPASNLRALREFSVGYEFADSDVYVRPDGVRIIRKSRVIEVSVVFRGSQNTRLLSVKNTERRPTHTPRLAAAKAAIAAVTSAPSARSDDAAVRRDTERLVASVRADVAREKAAAARFKAVNDALIGRAPDRLVLGLNMRPIIDERSERELSRQPRVVLPGEGETVRVAPTFTRAPEPPEPRETVTVPAFVAEQPAASSPGRSATLTVRLDEAP